MIFVSQPSDYCCNNITRENIKEGNSMGIKIKKVEALFRHVTKSYGILRSIFWKKTAVRPVSYLQHKLTLWMFMIALGSNSVFTM